MKNAAIIILAIVVGGALTYVAIAIMPFLIAMACIVLIYWMIAKAITGGFR